MEIWEIVILSAYVICLIVIFCFSVMQFHLTRKYKREYIKKSVKDTPPNVTEEEWPMVTVQLPVYNEMYVVERLIDSVAAFNYPKDRLEIQVLDDSTDESFDVAAKKVAQIAEMGIDITHIKRPERKGYKAGALQYGLKSAKGKYIAIFDSDFMPPADFLRSTIPFFKDPSLGMVQTRWGHINEDYSMLTRVQAFYLNAHFTVEQKGREMADVFMNFNGTAGVWRRAAMDDGGGWEADTLTEDLDLSYRTQMKGWKFKYLQDVVAPAELPHVMSAVKSQQYRWMKGGAETAKKHVKTILRADVSTKVKLHGLAHLFNSSIFIFVLLTALLSFPVLVIKHDNPQLQSFFHFAGVFFGAFLILVYFYHSSLSIRPEKGWARTKYMLKTFPMFLCISMGMALHNSVAVLKGYFGQESPFVRTPKFNITDLKDKWTKNKYLSAKLDAITMFEGILAFYFLLAVGYAFMCTDFSMVLFHLTLFFGFGSVFITTLKHSRFG